MNPYLYISRTGAKDQTMPLRDTARIAAHFPTIGRSIEIYVDERGRWSVLELPAPGESGEFISKADGTLSGRPSRV